MPFIRRVSKSVAIDGISCRFKPSEDIKWESWLIDGQGLPHPNTMRFRIISDGAVIKEQLILSVGGGFVETIDAVTEQQAGPPVKPTTDLSISLQFGGRVRQTVRKIRQTGLGNRDCQRGSKGTQRVWKLRARLSDILNTFEACIERGLATDGILPGGLNVKRRAKALWQQYKERKNPGWAGNDLRPSIYAIAVNEENAAGGRVVTAPTNGSSGLIPAVWRTLTESNHLSEETRQNGLMVASIIGALVKTHASS